MQHIHLISRGDDGGTYAQQSRGIGVGHLHRTVTHRVGLGRHAEQAALHVCHTLGRERVAAQVGKGTIVIQAVGVLQGFKQAHKPLRIKPRLRQHHQALAVRLLLHIPREVELVLDGRRLPTHNQCGTCIGAGGDGGGTQNHGANQPRRLALLGLDDAGNMALRHMAQLVREHRSQCGVIRGRCQQTQMKSKVTPGQCKRVDRFGAEQPQLPSKLLQHVIGHITARARRCKHGAPQIGEVLVEQRVFHHQATVVQAGHDLLAQPTLIPQR